MLKAQLVLLVELDHRVQLVLLVHKAQQETVEPLDHWVPLDWLEPITQHLDQPETLVRLAARVILAQWVVREQLVVKDQQGLRVIQLGQVPLVHRGLREVWD